MKRVAFIINFNPTKWLGGFNYIYNLIFFLKKYNIKNIDPVIITNNKKYFKKPYNFKGVKILETNLVNKDNSIQNIVRKLKIIIFGKDNLLESFLLENKIYATSHFEFTGSKSKIKSFTWFPDFQEINLPENFSYKSRILRRVNLYLAMRHSSKLLISSNSVLLDLKKISKKSYNKAVLIKHAINLPKFKFTKVNNSVLKKYKIKKKFFFLPNQYMKHKNHIIVLQALKKIKKKIDFQIVTTGKQIDHRFPQYTRLLKNFIKKNKLENNFVELGIIPFQTMIYLMMKSIAVINPSKSEGWSNTVEQASSIGKKVILSNIKVHKEQIGKEFYYFNPNSYQQLSNILLKHSKKHKKIQNFEKFVKNYQNYQKKQKMFIKKYEKIIIE